MRGSRFDGLGPCADTCDAVSGAPHKGGKIPIADDVRYEIDGALRTADHGN